MELVKEEDFATIRGRPKIPLYEEMLNLPGGSIVRCDPDIDFNGEPERFRQSVLYAMKRRNVPVQTRIKNGSVYIRIMADKEGQ